MTDAGVTSAVPQDLLRDLAAIVGAGHVATRIAARAVYECDGYTLERAVPDLVVHPGTVEETAEVVSRLAAAGMAIVPRGAGTSLAGGCLAPAGAAVVALTRLDRVEEIDVENRQALVQAGVVNAALSRRARGEAPLHFAPDPSSQSACTVGGNIANNSGGPHTLKVGVTVNHVLAVELVTPDGNRRWLGSRSPARGGLDLAGLAVGNEGTFGIVTRAWVRLTPVPPAARTVLASFGSVEEASRAVTAIIGSGVVPAAVEMMDALVLDALARAFSRAFPAGSEAVLLVEVDGVEEGLEEEALEVDRACRAAGAFEVRRADAPAERALLWKARKQAFAALGRIARSYCTQDGVVPRTLLPEALERIREIGARHRLRIANVFHAGDGNLHPTLLYDERDPGEIERVLAASVDILTACLELGGSLTGEHGIGVEKVALMERAFPAATLEVMGAVRKVFDPGTRCNPNKLLPAGGGCPDPAGPRPALGRVLPGRRAPQ